MSSDKKKKAVKKPVRRDWEGFLLCRKPVGTEELSQALSEIAYIDKYDYAVVNDELGEAVDRVKAIIKAEHSKVTEETHNLIEEYKED